MNSDTGIKQAFCPDGSANRPKTRLTHWRHKGPVLPEDGIPWIHTLETWPTQKTTYKELYHLTQPCNEVWENRGQMGDIMTAATVQYSQSLARSNPCGPHRHSPTPGPARGDKYTCQKAKPLRPPGLQPRDLGGALWRQSKDDCLTSRNLSESAWTVQ
jgi:hypothetical protein